MAKQSVKTLNIADLDMRTPSSEGTEIEITRPDGSGTGVFIRVLGDQSEAVEQYIIRKADDRAAKIIEARTRDRNASSTVGIASARTILDDEIESATVRTVGWRGLSEAYSEENAKKLYSLNRLIARQVITASQNEAFFMKA